MCSSSVSAFHFTNGSSCHNLIVETGLGKRIDVEIFLLVMVQNETEPTHRDDGNGFNSSLPPFHLKPRHERGILHCNPELL